MKKKIVWLVVSCLVVLALLVASCGGEKEEEAAVKEKAPAVKEEAAPAEEKPKYGGVLSYCLNYPVLAWDEAFQAPWMLSNNLAIINEELLVADWTRGPAGTGESSWQTSAWFNTEYIVGALAESWEHPDDETLIFHIRQGVHWALNPDSAASRLVNGRELTADDVVYNLKRIYFDITVSTMYGMLGDSRPTDVYATDKYTVVVKTPPGQSGMTLEAVADMTRIVPPEVVEKYGDINDWKNSVGTGPFMVTDYVEMSQATYVRNPNYWDKNPIGPGKGDQLPYLEGLKLLIIPDLSTRLAALRTGKLDHHYMWNGLDRDDAYSVINTAPQVKYIKFLRVGYDALGGRLDKPELPFDDIRVRRALMMGINDQEILDTVFQGEGSKLCFKVSPVKELSDIYTPLEELPPSADGFDNRKLYGYYPEEAKQLLAEAGYPDGFKTEVVLSFDLTDMLTVVKEYWRKIGVDLSLDVKEVGAFTSIYQKKTHKEMLMCGRSAHAPFQMYMVRAGNMYNWAMVNDPWIEQKYKELTEAYFDNIKRNALMSEINLYIIDHAWYWTAPMPYQYSFWQPWVKNYRGENDAAIYNNPLFFKYVWYDQALKKEMGY